MTQEQDRIQRKLRELIGDDRIRIVDASNATFIDDAGREQRSRSESEVRHFNQVRDRVFKPPLEDESSEIADVAVLLSCEKEDKYEYWITYLGNDRKDRFAYVGELPKQLQTEQYWAWESAQGGSFEFNPYRGATGGFGGGSTTPNNYDGAVVGVGPEGAFYQSEGWRGGGNGPVGNIENVADVPGGDLGGIVTPTWSRVLTDYSVTARTYLQTLCLPLDMYTDVTWEWSDGGGGYALRKVPGDGVTTSSSGKTIGTSWNVSWNYTGGGGGVTVNQVPSPSISVQGRTPDDGPTYRLVVDGQEFFSSSPFSRRVEERGKAWEPGVTWRIETCFSPNYRFGAMISEDGQNFTHVPYTVLGGDNTWRAYHGGVTPASWSFGSFSRNIAQNSLISDGRCGVGVSTRIDASDNANVYIEKDGQPFSIREYNTIFSTSGADVYSTGWVDAPLDEYFTETIPPVNEPSYTITVKDEDGVEVASDSASTPISYTSEKIEKKLVSFFINKDGQNINGQFDTSVGPIPDGFEDGDEGPEEYRYFDTGPDDEPPSVTGETRLVIARIDAWVEVAGKKIAPVTLNGQDGQAIIESPQYEEAIKPYVGPNGRIVYPCFPQKTEEPPKEETASFRADEGFNVYHVTWYNTRKNSANGDTTRYEPFDFGNPDLSGYLPSPSINYLYSLISTDLLVSYDPVARLSWGADVPEENPETGETTNLEEEQIDGIDRNGVLYPLVKGFTYGLYGPIKASNILLNQRIDKQAGQSLANYDMNGWNYRNRARKPRTYVLGPDDFEEGEPFEEFDVSDLNQRGLNQMQMTMGRTFRQSLWGYDLGPIGNEREEDWRHQAATFANVTSGGSTPNQRRFFNDPAFNSSNVRQSGDKRVDIKVNMDDVKALLRATERKDVRFLVYPEGGGNGAEPTEKTFKMNPIQYVFEGYEEVKILAVAGIIY